jgi:Ca2+-binding RTX toxin-like protein
MPNLVSGTGADDVIVGTTADDSIDGLGGNDVLTGNAGNDTLSGGDGIDILYGDYSTGDVGAGGNDILSGGAGNDLLVGGRGNDTLNGGDGDDLIYTGIASGYVLGTSPFVSGIYSTDGGDDVIDGGAGIDGATLTYDRATGIRVDISNAGIVSTILSNGVTIGSITGVERLSFAGGSGADMVTGGDYSDSLIGNGGNDVLRAGGGDDYLSGGPGDDTLDGGSGNDTADYSNATSGLTINLTLQGVAQNTGGGGTDTLTSIENVYSSAYTDILIGDASANRFSESPPYGNGNDEFYGNGGADTLSISRYGNGAASTVLLSGGADNDSINFYGSSRYTDSATLDGGAGSDAIIASGLGTGTISAGSENDQVTIDTLGGQYSISLGGGADTLTLAGTSGGFRAASAITVTDFATGTGGDILSLSNWLSGGALTNFTSGTNPFIDGHLRLLQSGNNTLFQVDRDGGGDAYATLITFQNSTATTFKPVNLGGYSQTSAGETVIGTAGNDLLTGEINNDVLTGLGGNDVLTGNGGNDILDGGDGLDILYGDNASYDMTGTGNDMLTGGAGNDLLIGGLGNDTLTGGDGDDTLYSGVATNASLNGTYFSIGGNSPFTDGGDDVIDGGAGNDAALLYYNRSAGITVDISNPNGVSTILSGGAVAGSITGVEQLTFYGGSGADVVTGGGASDTIYGNAGDDILRGGDGSDYLAGGAGNDRLDGGAGNDIAAYYDAVSGVTIDLNLQGAAQNTGGSGIDTLISIETLYGSTYSDIFTGDAVANYFSDSNVSGNDQFYGNGGADSLFISRYGTGPATTVTLSGGADNDSLIFSSARYSDIATIDGGAGADYISASGLGTGTISAGSENDQVTIDTLGGQYSISLGAGTDTLILAGTLGGSRAVSAITVTDFATGTGGDILSLSNWLSSGALTNLASGANPFLTGHLRLLQSGTSTLLQADRDGVGDAYATLITFQNTTATAFKGSNLGGISPTDEPNVISGTASSDYLIGTTGKDNIDAAGGDDTITLSQGADVIDGGAGYDRLYASIYDGSPFGFGTGARSYTITATKVSDASGILNTTFANIERLEIYDSSSVNKSLDASLFSGTGGVSTSFTFGTNAIVGSAYADNFSIGSGTATVDGGAGNDRLAVGLSAQSTSTLIVSRSGSDVLFTQSGVGTTSARNIETYVLYSPSINNALKVDASAFDVGIEFQRTGAGDVLVGGSGNDIIYSTYDVPTMAKGGTITGGAGADTFVYNRFSTGFDGDRITDLETSDRIDLRNIAFSGTPTTFIGNAAFSGVAGQYRYEKSGSQTLLQADTNGDGIADKTLTITNGAFFLAETTPGSNILQIDPGPLSLTGTANADSLSGNGSDDMLTGLGGNDVLTGNGGNDMLLGGDGLDILYGDFNASNTTSAGGNDMLSGGAGNDLLIGGRGNDTLNGGDCDDIIYNGVATGGYVSGTYLYTNAFYSGIDGDNDAIDGGAGFDTATLVYNRTAGVTVDISNPNAISTILSNGAAAGSITGIEQLNFYGGAGADNVTGGISSDNLSGGAGDDILRGGDGTDYLTGGAGNDLLDGGARNDVVQFYDATAGVKIDLNLQGTAQNTAGAGNDTLVSIENLYGSAYSDIFIGDANANGLNDSNGGNDQLFGNGGSDSLSVSRYGTGAATTVTLSGGADTDYISFSGSNRYTDTATLDGGAGADSIYVSGLGAGTILGGSENDYVTIDSLGGQYDITLGTGADTLALAGTSGGFRSVSAITVTDFVTGTGGDILNLGSWLAGGALINFTSGNNPFGDGHMRLLQSDTSTLLQVDRDGGGDSYTTLLTFQNTTATAFTSANLNGLSPTGSKVFYGTEGNDIMSGTSGEDAIDARGGDDIVYLTQGSDTIDGGSGTDQLTVLLNSSSFFTPPTAARTYTISADRVFDQSGMLNTSFSNVEIVYVNARGASNFNDTFDASDFTGSGGVRLYGGTGNDTMTGSAANDFLSPGRGTNVAYGGTGDDMASVSADSSSGASMTITRSGTAAVFARSDGSSDTYHGVENFSVFASIGDGGLKIDGSAFDLRLTLAGAEAGNILIGGSAADMFLSGYAETSSGDIFTGNGGTDTFQFYSFLYGLDGSTITDFSAEDVIDLATATYDGFTPHFIGTAAFTGVAGQYRATTSAGKTLIQADTDGNSVADRTLTLSNGTFDLVETATGSNILKIGAQLIVASIGNMTIVEGASGTSNAVFTVSLSAAATTTIKFSYTTADGTAIAGSDYTARSGTLTIAAGATSGQISVPITGDLLNEANESFTLTLSSPVGASFTGGATTISATATIQNDETIGDALANVINGTGAADGLYGAGGNDTLSGGDGNDLLDGGDGDDLILGGAGNDRLEGGTGIDTVSYADAVSGVKVSLALATAQNTPGGGVDTLSGFENLTGSNFGDTLTGDVGANVLRGGGGNDNLDGSDGDDTLLGGAGSDKLIGGNGIDTLSYDDATAGVTVSLAIAILQNTGSGGGNDTISGLENLTGSAFADRLTGDTGNNRLTGGAGDDVLNSGLGNNILDGGAGIDIVSYADATAGIRASLALTTLQTTSGAGRDQYIGIDGIEGGAFGDLLTGSGGNDILYGRDGNDTLTAGDGDDLMIGGTGSDKLNGGLGLDTASYEDATAAVNVSLAITVLQNTAGGGNDTLSSVENLLGSKYNDTLTGDVGANAISGGLGNDLIVGGLGNDVLDGGGGTDTISYTDATAGVSVSLALTTAQNTGAAGIDSLTGFENLTGSGFGDMLTGDGSANSINAGAGNDHVDGGNGDDMVFGGLGDDVLAGGVGIDTISYSDATSGITLSLALAGTAQTTGWGGVDTVGGFENITGSAYADILTGDAGANVLTGGAGVDKLDGGAGNDSLSGGSSADQLTGGAGLDTLSGGASGDRFIFIAASDSIVGAGDIITDFNHVEKDRIDLSGLYGGTMSFIGAAAFTGHAGELHYGLSGSDLMVSGDLDGDGFADFEIRLVGISTMEASDFLL